MQKKQSKEMILQFFAKNKMTKSKIDHETVKKQMPSPRTLSRRMHKLSEEQRGKLSFCYFDCNRLQPKNLNILNTEFDNPHF